MISRARSGDLSELAEVEEDPQVPLTSQPSVEEDDDAPISIRPVTAHTATSPAQSVPLVLTQLLGTDVEGELLAVAKFLEERNKRKLTLVFHTPIGDVKCPVNWSSTPPEQLSRSRQLLLILVRSSDSMFVPHPGAVLDISFAECHGAPRLRVMCLAPLMKLYPGVGVDLLCFLPQTDAVEKQGVVKAGAPSVVSGRPSDTVDDDGEPIELGEKSASSVLPPIKLVPDVVEDFDRPRND